MAWIRAAGGAAKKLLSKDIGNLILTSPVPTSAAPTNRTFTKNSAIKGLSSSNYYYPNNNTVTKNSDNSVHVVGVNNASYGYGYVLPDAVKGGDTLYLDVTRSTQTSGVTLAFYNSSGAQIGYSAFLANGSGGTQKADTVAIPASAEYVIILFITVNTSSAGVDFTLNDISIV